MKNQISAYLLIGLILLGVSASSVVYAQNTAQPQQTINSLAPQSGFTTNKVINLNDLDVSSSDRQSLEDVFENCPAGIILYQLSGQFYVYCLKTPVSGVLYGAGGQQIDIDIKVDRSSSNNDDNDDDDSNSNGPDEDCLFNASLPKCDPDEDGNCPDDFNLNEDGNCFPEHHDGCPSGTHGVDDDETGQCYDNDDGCPDGMELNDNGNNCGYIPDEEILPTPLDTAAMANTVTNTGEDKGFVDDATNNKILPDTEDNANAAASDTTTTDLNDEELEKGAVDEQPDSTTDTEDTDSNTETEDTDSNSNEPEGDTNEDSGDSDTNESDSESSSNDDGGSEESGGEEDNN